MPLENDPIKRNPGYFSGTVNTFSKNEQYIAVRGVKFCNQKFAYDSDILCLKKLTIFVITSSAIVRFNLLIFGRNISHEIL